MSTPINKTALEKIIEHIDLRLRLLELKVELLTESITTKEFIAKGVVIYDELLATHAAKKAAVTKSKSNPVV